jgi:hypothetical protein
MYFASSILTIISLIAFATFNYIVATKELDNNIESGLKWASLGAACLLVFAVQVLLLYIDITGHFSLEPV